MATPIGDAVVKVKIDTTEAQATLDRLDGRAPGGRDGGDGRRVPGRAPEGGRRPDQAPRKPPLTDRAGRVVKDLKKPSALPIVGGVLAAGVLVAEYGPAAGEFVETITDRVLDKIPGNEAIKFLIRKVMKFQIDQTNAQAEAIAQLQTIVMAGFGSLQDTKQIAKAAYLFNGKVNPDDLLAFLEGQFQIRRAQGMGRWAERQITRKAIGEGLGNSIADLISTQE